MKGGEIYDIDDYQKMLDTSPNKFNVKRTDQDSTQHNQTFMGSNVDPQTGIMNHLIGHKLNNTMNKTRETVKF